MTKLLQTDVSDSAASRDLAMRIVQDYLLADEPFTLFLEGGLGVGKTFFVSEMLQSLGVAGSISSPTYGLVNEYDGFAHFDFYRLEDPNDFFARGFTDIADDKAVSCFVEWPEKISKMAQKVFSGPVYTLKIDFGISEGARQVVFCRER